MPPVRTSLVRPFLVLLCGFALQHAAPGAAVVDLKDANVVQRFTPSSDSVAVLATRPGVQVTASPGADSYPGASLKPLAGASLDLSAYGYVEATVFNPGTDPIGVTMRVDNLQHGAFWIANSTKIPPGQSKPIRVYLSKPVNGFEPAKVSQILFFTGAVKTGRVSFRIDSIAGGGTPGEIDPNPADVRTVPPGGKIYSGDLAVVPAQLAGKGNGGMSFADNTLRATLTAAAGKDAVAMFRPPVGAWNLREYLEVRVSVENDGPAAITPSVRLDSIYGPSDTVSPATPLAPGATTELVVPFIALQPWKGNADSAKAGSVEGSGSSFASSSVQDVAFSAMPLGQARTLKVLSIQASLPPPPEIPGWVGKSPPPGSGDWVKTFDDEFDGNTLNRDKWTSTGENWYDKVSHYSMDNVLVGGGFARLRYEKKTGYHNDSSSTYQTDYATGYLDTFDKFFQRYGYFECRVKLPKAPGLWPAFWLMPDRPGKERPGVRGSTSNGGMEFDVLEWLETWGQYRYNVAMHWDGYGKDHRATGTKPYVQPDKEGFINASVLWTPGLAVFYANGRELLRFESPRVANVPEDIMFTLPSGGWDGNHLDMKNPQLPDDLIIDYVRVWQRRDLSSAADAVQATR